MLFYKSNPGFLLSNKKKSEIIIYKKYIDIHNIENINSKDYNIFKAKILELCNILYF